MSERNYYCICEDNCKFPTMTSEQILAAIAEATGNTPRSVDNAFITKLKEMNAGGNLTVWVGTSAEYAAIVESDGLVANRLYITTDDTFESGVNTAIEQLQSQIAALSADTGWLPIKRWDKNEMSKVIIGKYRIIGKTAYINIEYDYTDFLETSATSDTIVLPVVLDCPSIEGVRGFEFTIPAVEERETSPLYTFRVAQIGVDYTGLKVYNISLNNDYYRTQISFSAPFKEMNSAYTL